MFTSLNESIIKSGAIEGEYSKSAIKHKSSRERSNTANVNNEKDIHYLPWDNTGNTKIIVEPLKEREVTE
jgi:hypothetical protein